MTNPSQLDSRFLPPKTWETHYFDNPETSHRVRYSFLPADNKLKANLVILPGLSEFGEKYIETAIFFAAKGFDVYVIDWAYQGMASRYNKIPHKRHSDGYEADISDLDFLIHRKITNDKPFFMLAHSMGGNIGLRYLIDKPEVFKAASISAPLLGIQDLKSFTALISFILKLLSPFHHSYVPGGHDWKESNRSSDGKDIFSSDPVRDQIHNYWSLHNPDLQVGSPTLKWLYESLKSIHFVKSGYDHIQIPVLIALAGKEKLVDNEEIKNAAKKIKKGSLLVLEGAKHEILMETDDIRDQFLSETIRIFTESI